MSEDNIQLLTFKYPEQFEIDYVVKFLNQALNDLQEKGFMILSVKHDGDNRFLVEVRKVI